jgi:penicillin amidase
VASNPPPAAPRFRLLGSVLSLLLLAGLVGAGWFYGRMRASLPQLDGKAALAGLSAPVAVERDALGVPTILGASRTDVARALGFLHAQDRFFQMDLLRRRAAGELAELFGPAALPLDRQTRPHRFRARAHQVLAQAGPEERAVLLAYTAGVNAGLAALRAKPFEYYILRAQPQPWSPDDCALVAYAMALTLLDSSGHFEHSLSTLRDTYGIRAVAFFSPLLSPGDAALDGSTGPLAPIPSAEVINLRAGEEEAGQPVARAERAAAPDQPSPGSNSFAVAGGRTSTGAGLLASDMHLELAVPNTWYRVAERWGDHALTGLTLPGAPFLVAGSNGHIAWGFTDAFVDTGDLVLVTPYNLPGQYHGPPPGGILDVEKHHDLIAVKGRPAVAVDSEWTVWGQIVGHNADDRPLAFHWTLDDPEATNFHIMALESAPTTEAAVTVAHTIGLPALNFLVADTAGHIAWTVVGRLPRRVGFDGRLPTRWDFGDRHWAGFLPPAEVPTVNDPARPFLWTANSRLLGGRGLALLGDGGYERPARQAQIRDDLQRLLQKPGARARPADLLAIQLDDRAVFLARWRDFLEQVLTPEAVAAKSSRGQLRAALGDWSGRAAVDSVSYHVVESFRLAVIGHVLDPIFAPCFEADPDFDWRRFHYEDAVWAIVHAQPRHLLAPAYASWEDLLLAAADQVGDGLSHGGSTIGRATWGRHNTLAMRHPLAYALPEFLTRWLAMPAQPLPGDVDMPRVQTPDFGASARFVVSPGHEAEGLFEMPGGESGHPLSPFYRAGHEAWVRGEPAPFLPGPAAHRLSLIALSPPAPGE